MDHQNGNGRIKNERFLSGIQTTLLAQIAWKYGTAFCRGADFRQGTGRGWQFSRHCVRRSFPGCSCGFRGPKVFFDRLNFDVLID